MSGGPLDLTSDEVRLVKEYTQIRLRLDATEARMPEADPRGDVDLEGPAPVLYRTPSGEECQDIWRARYPTLASTEPLRARIEPLRTQLIEAMEKLPEPLRGRQPREVVEAHAETVKTLRRAVSWFARYARAVEALRAYVSHWTGEADHDPVDAYAIGGTVIHSDAHRRYDRWRVRVTRLSPHIRKKERAYDRARNKTEARKAYMRDYMRARRRTRQREETSS